MGWGAAKTLEDGTGASGPRGRLAEMRPARPSRAQKGAVGARRVASASRPHLGHHFLELALRHRHGGHLAAPVPVGRGSAAPGPPQAAPHNRTPSSQPPTPPPLTTGSRPPRRPFRFLHVTSEVRLRLGVGLPSTRCSGEVPQARSVTSDEGKPVQRSTGVSQLPLGEQLQGGKVLPVSFND